MFRQMLPLTALLALLLAACGRPAASQEASRAAPTRTPRPTWTPLPPTPTVAPTPTPLLEKSGPEVAAAIRAAIDRTTAIESYRMQYTLAAKSYKRWRSAEAAPKVLARPDLAQLDLDKKIPLVTLTGEYQGKSARTTTIYHCVECKDGQGDRKFDVLTVDDTLYMLYSGNTWFVVDKSVAADALVSFQGNRLLRRVLNERVDLNSFQAIGFETFDKRQCAVYADYGRAAVNALAGLYAIFGENEDAVINQAINAIRADESALKIWACDDGLVHRLTIELTAYQKDNPDQPFAASQELRIYDSGAAIKITPPPGAIRLDTTRRSQELTAVVFNGGNIRAEPTGDGQVLGQLNAGETVTLLARSPDGRWYYLDAPEAEGWAHSSLLTVDPAVAAQVPLAGDDAAAQQPAQPEQQAQPTQQPEQPAALTATVFNGGNLRAEPSAQGKVLDQINAGETVTLLGKRGVWYQIRNQRAVEGWVHSSLLTVDPAVAAQVPSA